MIGRFWGYKWIVARARHHKEIYIVWTWHLLWIPGPALTGICMGPRLVRENIETDGGGAAAKYHWSEKQWRWGLFTACYALVPWALVITCTHIVHQTQSILWLLLPSKAHGLWRKRVIQTEECAKPNRNQIQSIFNAVGQREFNVKLV